MSSSRSRLVELSVRELSRRDVMRRALALGAVVAVPSVLAACGGSSDEDVLSDTAEPRQAGGYLSWFLRRGVLGDADSRPSDGVLMAGELTDYLHDGFVRDNALMNPPGSLDPAQRLIVQRGSLPWGHLLGGLQLPA